jgi:hypothetical protein
MKFEWCGVKAESVSNRRTEGIYVLLAGFAQVGRHLEILSMLLS